MCGVVVILVAARLGAASVSFISLCGCAATGVWVNVVSIGIDPDEHSHITHAHDLFGVAAILLYDKGVARLPDCSSRGCHAT